MHAAAIEKIMGSLPEVDSPFHQLGDVGSDPFKYPMTIIKDGSAASGHLLISLSTGDDELPHNRVFIRADQHNQVLPLPVMQSLPVLSC